jgi:hypothetical protein
MWSHSVSAKFARIERGMTYDQVREIMGHEPEYGELQGHGFEERWVFGGSTIVAYFEFPANVRPREAPPQLGILVDQNLRPADTRERAIRGSIKRRSSDWSDQLEYWLFYKGASHPAVKE